VFDDDEKTKFPIMPLWWWILYGDDFTNISLFSGALRVPLSISPVFYAL
jgi:hypothetical protein